MELAVKAVAWVGKINIDRKIDKMIVKE